MTNFYPKAYMTMFVILSVCFFFAIKSSEEQTKLKLIEQNSFHVVENLESTFSAYISALSRMANRWENQGGTKKGIWERDARNFIRDWKGLTALEWVDSTYHVRWVVPLMGNEKAVDLNLAFEEKRKRALESAKIRKTPTITDVIDLVQGGKGVLVYIPLFVDNKFDGFILAVIRLSDMFNAIEVPEGIKLHYHDAHTNYIDVLDKKIPLTIEITKEWHDIYKSKMPFIVATIVLIVGMLVTYILQLLHTNRLERKQKEEKEERLEMALDVTGIGFWDWNLATDQVLYDSHWCGMLGYKITELRHESQTWMDLCHHEDWGNVCLCIDEYLVGKIPEFRVLFRMKHKKGHYIHVISHGYISERDSNGNPKRFTGTHTDVTEQREAEHRAKEASVAKSHFLANMSHEIRTPMNGINGACDLLKDTELNSEQKVLCNMIRSSCSTLLSVVNDILDFSKIEANKLKLENIPFDIVKEIKEVYTLFEHEAKKKTLDFDVTFNNVSHSMALGDPTRLKQILINLVSNAIKFTSEGYVRIATTISETEKNLYVEIKVQDSGIGMTNEQMQNIFEGFQQADVSTTREYGGTGLGLTISKQLAEMMNGDLFVYSVKDKGSCFSIDISFRKTDQLLEDDVDSAPSIHRDNDIVLVVEDNKINMKVIEKTLEGYGITVLKAWNGKEGYEMAMKEDHDMILMDIQMPVMNGMEAAQKLLADGYKKPIVALTANVMDDDIKQYKQIGFNEILGKPFKKKELEKILSRYLVD